MTIRVWAAVKAADGIPEADVRDYASADEYRDSETYRIWRLSALAPDCSVGNCAPRRCEVGKPCAQCQLTAVEWWDEWEVKKKNREEYEARKIFIDYPDGKAWICPPKKGSRGKNHRWSYGYPNNRGVGSCSSEKEARKTLDDYQAKRKSA